MPNIGVLLKQEITRLCRREIKKETGSTRKASATYRRDIAALKRKVAELERKASQLSKSTAAQAKQSAPQLPDRPIRFVAKGFRTLRKRLKLSAPQMGKLLGASEQSIYNWETKVATPRKDMMAKIVALRSIGTREAHQRLEAMPPAASKKAAKKSRKKRRASKA